VQIEPLAAHPELVDVIARWHWDEWGGPESDSLERWAENLRRGGRDGIPITFIALEHGQPLGSVTLTEHDMPGHIGYANFNPWLAGAFVAPEARGQGIGALLLRHAVEQAEAWGIPRLYLYTQSASRFYEHLGWTTLDETEYEGGRVTVMTISTDLPVVQQVPGARRLSQRISEGDGIAIIVRVDHADAARDAEVQGAKAVAVSRAIEGIRAATNLPLLWIGRGAPVDADAVTIRPEDDMMRDDDLETVVDVRDDEELELALERLDPEIFLLCAHEIDADADPLDAVLELLPDVPAGKLAIAQVDVSDRDEVLALERAGIDAVLVPAGHVGDLVGHQPLEV
jgi:GNAT superfamily N-acetyltransferase